jgi:hypothetical protein
MALKVCFSVTFRISSPYECIQPGRGLSQSASPYTERADDLACRESWKLLPPTCRACQNTPAPEILAVKVRMTIVEPPASP